MVEKLGDILNIFLQKKREKFLILLRDIKMKKFPLVVLAGKEYGTGSSRDWAVKAQDYLG